MICMMHNAKCINAKYIYISIARHSFLLKLTKNKFKLIRRSNKKVLDGRKY
jgi:hypothetical protein